MGPVTDKLETHGTSDIADSSAARGQIRGEHRLNRALAWVGIVAGCVFIVATVFFSGFVLGRHGGGHHHGPHPTMAKMWPGPGGPRGPGAPMGPAGPEEGPNGERPTPPSPQTTTLPRP